MKPTVAFIEKKFDEFNRRMFSGRLPRVPVELSDASGFLGKCVFHVHRQPDGLHLYSDFRLRFNTRIDLPENVVEDIIIHEMIHYFILWSGLQDSSSHGAIFKSIMGSINSSHGRNISIRHQFSPEEAEQAVSSKRTWHIIAAVYMKNGKTGVKVLPRSAPKVIEYYRVVSSNRDIKEVRLFLHDNPYFNRYPTSAAFRIYEIDKSTLETNLIGARPLRINGSSLVEVRPY